MRTILVTGAAGLLGSSLVPFLRTQGHSVITHARSGTADFLNDLNDLRASGKMLEKIRPDIIVNLCGLTSVEISQEQPNAAYLGNTRTVESLSGWIKATASACHLIQISTDHVYDGVGPHKENEICLTNSYAFSKYAGELAASCVNSTILRTNFIGRSKATDRESLTDWVYYSLTSGRKVQVFDDVFFNPLSIDALCEMIHLVVEQKPVGTFNLGSKQGMSKADFDFAFAACLDLDASTMTRIQSSQATFLKAYRPKDMRMDCSHFEKTMGITLPLFTDELKRVALEYDEIRSHP